MAYVTWTEFADALQGEARMKALNPKLAQETSETHPFFTSQLAIASRRADLALDAAGFVTPLESVDDPLLRNAIIGLLAHVLTETSSSREPFVDALRLSALAYFKDLAAGSITVIGATEDETPENVSLVMGTGHDAPVFDVGGSSDRVFARLGPWGGYWRGDS